MEFTMYTDQYYLVNYYLFRRTSDLVTLCSQVVYIVGISLTIVTLR